MVIKPAFQNLIHPLLKDEFEQLEKNCLAEGIREPLIVWHNGTEDVLVDGHHRYQIAQKHSLPFKTVLKNFDNEYEVIDWIINNQLGRRNSTEEQKSYLRGKQYHNEKARHGGDRKSKKSSCHNDNLISEKSSEKLAEQHGVSPRTITRDDKFADGVDTIANIAPEKKTEILQGQSDFTKKDVSDFAEIAKEKREAEKLENPLLKKDLNELIDQRAKELLKQKEAEKQAKTEQRKEFQRQKMAVIAHNDKNLPEKKYRIIYADPPWRYDHKISESRKIENQYPTMTLDDICDLKVPEITQNDSILFLWVTSPHLKNGMQVLESWGFEYKTCAVWDKQVIGMGYFFRQQHELILVGIKGNMPTPLVEGRFSSVFSIKRGGHSEKPVEIAEAIEKMYPDLSKIELFCRSPRDGWDAWGNEV
jgi:N6-adenosine-specific RNA methylase IME4